MKRIIALVIVLLLAAAGWFGYQRVQAQQQEQALASIQTQAAERGNLTALVGATGIVRANQTALLTWGTSGVVETVDSQVGDKVDADQVLASLRQTSLPQNVILAQSELTSAQQAQKDLYTQADSARVKAMQEIVTYEEAVKNAQLQLDNFTIPTNQSNLDTVDALNQMKGRLEQARAAFEPYRLSSSGDPNRVRLREALDNAQSDYNAALKRLQYEYDLEVAQANLDRAQQDYEKWKNGPDPADIQATESRIAAAQATLDLRRILAPFAGTLTEIQVRPGDLVAPGVQAFRLDDLSHILVDVSISEVDINRIQANQPVQLTFDAIPGRDYNGQVIEVASVGTSTQGVVDFMVTVELTDADEQVRPGMTAAVNIVVDELQDVLLVPNRAVRVREGQRVVFVLKNGVPTPVEITLGASSDTSSEVLSGELQPGDPIVLNPPVEFNQPGGPGFMGR